MLELAFAHHARRESVEIRSPRFDHLDVDTDSRRTFSDRDEAEVSRVREAELQGRLPLETRTPVFTVRAVFARALDPDACRVLVESSPENASHRSVSNDVPTAVLLGTPAGGGGFARVEKPLQRCDQRCRLVELDCPQLDRLGQGHEGSSASRRVLPFACFVTDACSGAIRHVLELDLQQGATRASRMLAGEGLLPPALDPARVRSAVEANCYSFMSRAQT
jgi:hypothetical protein